MSRKLKVAMSRYAVPCSAMLFGVDGGSLSVLPAFFGPFLQWMGAKSDGQDSVTRFLTAELGIRSYGSRIRKFCLS